VEPAKRPSSYLRFVMVCASLSGINPAFSAELVKDDVIKIEVLKAAFPRSRVHVSQQKPLDWKPDPWPGHALLIAKSVKQPGQITIGQTLSVAFTLAKPEEYQDLRGFYQKVAAADQQQLVLTTSAAVAAAPAGGNN